MTDGISQPSAPKILVCDDDLMVRMLARECLEEAGMVVVEAADGHEAIDQFFNEIPDLVFLDVEMPGRTGFEVCEAIRSSPTGANTPIMLATGADDKDSIDRGFSVGATQYKTKPINWSLLSRDIRYMLRAAEAFVELKAQEDRLRYLAYFDHLTDLPNRRSFNDQLKLSTESGDTGLLIINLDHFKRVNDSIGHDRGDQLLQSIAKRLQEQLATFATIGPFSSSKDRSEQDRSSVHIARPSGDEFSVIVHDCSGPMELLGIGNSILEALTQPIQVDSHQLVISPSIGMAMSPEHGLDADTLLRSAESAMRAAKLDGRGRQRLYDESLNDDAAERLRLEADLRVALERDDQLEMVYQPQIDTRSGQMLGVEALIRWHHPDLGSISPARFIPVAESSGLIIPLGDWILRRVNKDALEAGNRFPKNVAISINLSPLQFSQSNFVETLHNTLAKLDLVYQIELELTEGVIMSDASDSLKKLQALKTLGFDLAIDDFGTGYSSLSYLRSFPIDTLKIDRSFVVNIGTPGGDGIVMAILSLARALNLRVVAEGVETYEQAAFLYEHECTLIQGYLLAKPLPVGELIKAMDTDFGPLLRGEVSATGAA